MREPEHGPDAVSGPDDMGYADTAHRDRRSKRSSAPPKKAEGSGIKGLFSSLKRTTRPETTELPERRKSRSHRDRGAVEDAKYPGDPEEARRRRREERKRQQARQDLEGDGMATDAVPGEFPAEAADPDDPEARRAARRAQRASHHSSHHRKMSGDSEAAREAEERRARRKEKERAREEREQQLRDEEEEKRREEKRARRAAREERRAREEQEAQEAQARAEAKAAERRERRRMKEEELAEAPPVSRHASKSRRHRSRAGDPAEEPHTPRRSHHDYDPEQERHRAPHRSGEKDKDKGSKKRRPKSQHPPPAPAPPAAVAPDGTPLMSGGRRDKISSWVHSQADDPPEPPPIVPTVLDVPPPPGEPLNTHSISSDEEARKDMRRKAKRRSRHPGPRDDDMGDARARKRESRKSAAVRHDTRRDGSSGSGAEDHYPPAQPMGFGKSWFKRFMG